MIVKTLLPTLLLALLAVPNRREIMRRAIAREAAARSNTAGLPAAALTGGTNAAIGAGAPMPFDPTGRPPLPPPGGRPPGGRPLDPNSIIVPATPPPLDPSAPGPGEIVIHPSAAATNTAMDQIIEVGTIDFKGVDVNQVLKVYAELVNKTILRPATLAGAPVWLTTQTPLTKREVIQALDAVLGMSGIAMIPFGDKFMKADATGTANQAGSPFNKLDAAHLAEFGSYVTHVVQLHFSKPTELVPVLTPFGKIPGGVTAIDSSQILVLRDFTENVKRMLEMIREIDVAVPAEYIQEVIPIKYAKATDIAGALNSLSTGGGGATVGSGGSGGTRSSTMGRTGGSFGNRPGGVGSTYPGQTRPPRGRHQED